VARNCGVGSPQEYEEPLQLLRSAQGSQPSVVITTAVQELSRYTRDFVERYRATISEKHAELLRRFSGESVANSASILSKPEERAYVLAVLQAFKHMNNFLNIYSGTPSSKTHGQAMSTAARNAAEGLPKASQTSVEEAVSVLCQQENLLNGDGIPVIAGSAAAPLSKSPTTSIFSEHSALSVPVECNLSVERAALPDKVADKQDATEVKGAREIDDADGSEQDFPTRRNPEPLKSGELRRREASVQAKPDSCLTACQEESQRGNSWSRRALCVKLSNRRSERYLPVQDPGERWISHFGTISWNVCPGSPHLRSLLERSRSKTYGARPWTS
jgi:hypothetical protein